MPNIDRYPTFDEDNFPFEYGRGRDWEEMAKKADEEKKQREAEESKTEEMDEERYKRLQQGLGGLSSDDPENPNFYDGIHTH